MARKKSVTDQEYRRMLAARQGRAGGRFAKLKPEYQTVAAAEESRKRIGLPIGDADKGALALIQEAQRLAADVEESDSKQAQDIIAKFEYLKKLAAKAKGDQTAIMQQLDQAIAPVEKELRKKASFREFLKEKVTDFRKKLPEQLAGRIPLIGGFAGEFLRQRRESKEELQRYGKRIMGSGGRGRIGRDIFSEMGGSRASDIPGLGGMDLGKSAQATLGGIYKEITQIRGILQSQLKPGTEELTKRESELEGLTKTVGKAGAGTGDEKKGGLLSSLLKMFMGGKEGGGMLSTIAQTAGSLGTSLLGGAGRVGRFARGLGGTAMKFIRGTGAYKTLAEAGKSVMSIGGRIGTSVAQSGVGKAVGSVASKAGGFFGGLLGKAGGLLGKLNPMSLLSGPIKSGAGKIVKGITSIPGLGAIIETLIGAMDIADIKSNPEMSPDEKKEKIGTRLVSTIGAALGSVGGGALGTFIPIPGIGTIVGSLGGSWVGGKIAELLAEQIGGKGIYDMAASIPGIGSLIEVGGAEDQKTKTEAEGQVKEAGKSAASATTTGQGGESSTTTVEGKITAPATANTSLGRMANQYNAEKNALDEANANTGYQFGKGPTTNTSNIQTRISNTNNHFNDDLRIRNNEPTQKQMQTFSIVP